MASLSTHVLDTAAGGPRVGLPVTVTDDEGRTVGDGVTDGDGRIAGLATRLGTGTYRVTWQTAGSFLAALTATVVVADDRHYHVPLLVSPVSATTYLGV